MSEEFDRRIIEAVRATGPDAYPSAVYGWIDTTPGVKGSLAIVMGRLTRLAGQGALRERMTVDERGRDRRAYSMGVGTPVRRKAGAWQPSGRLATSG